MLDLLVSKVMKMENRFIKMLLVFTYALVSTLMYVWVTL